MKRVAIVVGLGLVVLAIVLWRMRGDASSSPERTGSRPTTTAKPVRATQPQARPDPTKLARASIAGTVTDDKQVPIANARVCASGKSNDLDPELLRDLACVSADSSGHYKLASLLPATYLVSAAAKPFRPDVHHPQGDPKKTNVRLAAGQHLTGVDIALRPGGVELTGVVSDLTGGPIEKARVTARGNRWTASSASVTTETAADGTFSLWVAPGNAGVLASAEGYTDDWEWTYAPGKLELQLTPESSLTGTVVDAASGEPVGGARVSVDSSEWSEAGTFTDANGVFRVARLTPGRYVAVARTDRGYGRSEGSTLVGLGQSVDGVVVKLHPAARIEGTVVISTTKQPCEAPEVSLADGPKRRWTSVRSDPDGRVWAEGVLPGKYTVDVECDGYRAKDKYDAIVVADKDVTGLVWEVDPGAKVTGRVLAKAGTPVEGAFVSARTVGGEARKKGGWGNDRSLPDGTYSLDGLPPGAYKLEVSSDKAVAPKDGFKVEVVAGATVQQDLVLEETGAIKGLVVDSEGKPVPGIRANARALSGSRRWGDGEGRTDETGAFTVDGLRPGDYRVVAQRSWSASLRKPGTTDDAEQGERVTVRANQVANVRIVVESQTGVIEGTVTDSTGSPVGDAFISAARESDAAGAQKTGVNQTRWTWDEKPVVTNTDGTFTLSKLSPGTYTVRAYRKGGGEAVAEHVAIGGTATLQIKPTGAIAGTVRTASGPPEEMSITLRDLVTGFTRRESFFRTDGRFSLSDLPKGKFQLTAAAEAGQAQLDIALGEGEHQSNVAVELVSLVSITGRIVEHGTTKPVATIRMMAQPAMGGGGFSFSMSDEREFITDERGRFTIKNVPRGKLMLRGMPRDWNDSDYTPLLLVREVRGDGTIDLGDLPIYRKRVKANDPVGKLGIRFAESPPDQPPDQRVLAVSWIDPAGPAAKTELKVGDVVTSVDGVDMTGAGSLSFGALTRAAPGTKLALGLQRGTTITVVLAVP